LQIGGNLLLKNTGYVLTIPVAIGYGAVREKSMIITQRYV
jgi:hypothetical protein